MPTTDVPTLEGNPNSPPRPFAVAAWFGMSQEEILAGLRDGTIAPPPGAPPDWTPPGFATVPNYTAVPDVSLATGGSAVEQDVLLGRTQVQGWFQGLDANMSDATFDGLWKRSGDNDAARAANLTAYLARTLLGTTLSPVQKLDAVGMQVPSSISAALTAFTADPAHHAQLVDLAGMDGAQLAKFAQTDIGYRYALSQLDTLALTGNRSLFAGVNVDSGLDRFDPDTGESQLSDAWLADRGKFLAWKMAADDGRNLSIDGSQSWSFIDRSRLDADGEPLTVELAARKDEGGTVNQVIFGAASSEFIVGKAGTDRIYGGDGDDVLRGAAGADYLEGGHGDDLAFGGSGNDELVGNQGNDDLDGGRGADRLDGGSGDDTLTGGRGNDSLAGGVGNDTYVIDSGDGTDTIVDADGLGSISLDDETVTGGAISGTGKWTSTDGRLDYSLDGNLDAGGTLTIRAYSESTKHTGTPDNVVQVRNWHNGDLGITLGADDTSEQSDGTQDPGPAASGPEPDVDFSPIGGQNPPMDVPQPDITPISPPIDVSDSLDQLLGAAADATALVDPTQLQQAVAEFSGVLVPPDISFSGSYDDIGAVSIADVTDALAGDTGGDDIGHEAESGLVQLPPEWHRAEDFHASFEGSARGAGNGVAVARR